jgi:hypothetical protein
LDLVRHRLYKSLGTAAAAAAAAASSRSALKGCITTSPNKFSSSLGKKRVGSRGAVIMTTTAATTNTMAMAVPATKRQRLERRTSTALMALADLYRDVAHSSSSPSVNDVIVATMGAVVANNNKSNSAGVGGQQSNASTKDAPSPVVAPATSFNQPVHALSV